MDQPEAGLGRRHEAVGVTLEPLAQMATARFPYLKREEAARVHLTHWPDRQAERRQVGEASPLAVIGSAACTARP